MADNDITVQSADGITHQFPAGTDLGVIDGVMKTYAKANIAPEPESAPVPASGALKGMAKAAGQEFLSVPGKLTSAYGSMVQGGAVAAKSYLERPRADLQEQVKVMEMVDAGVPISARRRPDDAETGNVALAGSALRFSRDYAAQTPEQRAEMRAAIEGRLKDMPAFEDTLPGKVVKGVAVDIGKEASRIGAADVETAKKVLPLTPEEEQRGTVITTKILAVCPASSATPASMPTATPGTRPRRRARRTRMPPARR